MVLSGIGMAVLFHLVGVCLASCTNFRPLTADFVVSVEQRQADYVGEPERAVSVVIGSSYPVSQDVTVQQ